MCLILFAYKSHPRYELVLAANRDEFYRRPTSPIDYWPDCPDLLAGRDLEQNGTWMGITRNGRIAAVTNYRDPIQLKVDAPSRGHLVSGFLKAALSPADYLHRIEKKAGQYNGFNLIAGDHHLLMYYSNRGESIEQLQPGIYGLSNHLLNSNWPKVGKGREALKALLEKGDGLDPEALLELLQDQHTAPDDQLPHTGVSTEWERTLSPAFITSPTYGTRCSSVVLVENSGRVLFVERSWRPAQAFPQALFTRCFSFTLQG